MSGSVTITIDDRDNSQSLSTNDMMTLAFFNQCRETSTDLSNGTVASTVSNVVADNAQRIEFGATLAFQHVSIVDGGNSASIDGSVAVAAVVTSSSVQMSIAVGSGALTVAATAPGYSDNIVYAMPGASKTTNTFIRKRQEMAFAKPERRRSQAPVR